MAAYITEKLRDACDKDKALFISINKIMMEWNPIELYCIPEKEYEFTSLDILKILKETGDINKVNEYFDEEYFDVNSVTPEKRVLLNDVKQKLIDIISANHGTCMV